MRFLALFGFLLGATAMVAYPAARGKAGGIRHSGAREARTRNLVPHVEIPGSSFGRPGMTDPSSSTTSCTSLPTFPIISRLDPVIDGVIFGVLSHQRYFAADFGNYPPVAKLASKPRRSATRRR